MYLAKFATSAGEWLQAAVSIQPVGPTWRANYAWAFASTVLAMAARIPDATIARRITIGAQGMNEIISLTMPAEHEQRLRDAIGRLTRLERSHGLQVSLSRSQEERDGWFGKIGAHRVQVARRNFNAQGLSLACNFRAIDLLDDLFADAQAGGYTLSYQLHVRGMHPSSECIRAARRNVMQLQDVVGIPAPLVQWQEQLARKLGEATAIQEEYLAVDSSAATATVAALLTERFEDRYRAFGFPHPGFMLEQGTHEDSLANAVHSYDIEHWPPVDICGAAINAAERDHMFACTPAQRILQALAENCDGAEEAGDLETAAVALPSSGTPLPAAYQADGPYAFISYKRQDLERVLPALRRLQEHKVSFWYDKGIPGGAEWDEVIEEKITHANCVILFASQAALDSKYVRREVKFADALNIPLLPVALEELDPAHGMRMLLSQYQLLDIAAAELMERIKLMCGMDDKS